MRMCLFMGTACAPSVDADSSSRFSPNPPRMSSLDHILIGRYCGKSHAQVAEADRAYCSWVIGARSLPRSLMPFKTWLKQTHGGVLPYGKYKNAFFSEILNEHPEHPAHPGSGWTVLFYRRLYYLGRYSAKISKGGRERVSEEFAIIILMLWGGVKIIIAVRCCGPRAVAMTWSATLRAWALVDHPVTMVGGGRGTLGTRSGAPVSTTPAP